MSTQMSARCFSSSIPTAVNRRQSLTLLCRTIQRVGAPIGARTPRPMTMLRAALNATSSERSKKLPKAADDLKWLLDRADALAEDAQRDQQCRNRQGGAPTPLQKDPTWRDSLRL